MPPATSTESSHRGLVDQLTGLDSRFWIVNVMEMFERLAYYGVRAVIAIYMVLPLENGGPQFTHVQKGSIFAAWASVQSVLPVFTGGFADRYGHKRTIVVAIIIKIVGYVLMAVRMDYFGFFIGCMFLAAGTAIFKPGVQGTLAATLKKSEASVGWAIFYQLVNIGGFLGPVVAGILRLLDWKYVFYSCAVIVAVNFLWLPFYKDPSQEQEGNIDEEQARAMSLASQSVTLRLARCWAAIWCVAVGASGWYWFKAIQAGSVTNEWLYFTWAVLFAVALVTYVPRKAFYDEGQSDPYSVFVVSVVGLFQHRVLWFCLLFAGFWLMFNQVFDLLPNVIDDWVDTSGIIATLGSAFSTGAAPTVLSLFLGVVFGGVCAAGVFLAMRPDHRQAHEIPLPAYAVVAIALGAACTFPVKIALGGPDSDGLQVALGSSGLGLLLAAITYRFRLPARLVAIVAWVGAALTAIISLRASLVQSAPGLIEMAEAGAQVPPEWMINANPALIVFTMVGFGYLTSFIRPLTSILIGMVVATVGAMVAGTAALGWACIAGIAIFSIGEMLSSPKKMEYLATLAKKGQEGLFMGYANMPVAIGWIVGSIMAGEKYEKDGDKVNLAKRHLEDVLNVPTETVQALKESEVVPYLGEQLSLSAIEVQRLLFEVYKPYELWYEIGAIGLASIVGMVGYGQFVQWLDKKSEEQD